MTLFVVENITKTPRRKVFTFLGVDYYTTSRAWMNPPLMAIIGITVALILAPTNPLLSQIAAGIGYGFLIIIASFWHGVGHIISSRLVQAPMQAIILTATVNISHYEDDEEQSSYVHSGRALGGPVFNLLLGLIAIVIYMSAIQNHFLLFFGSINLFFGLLTLLPIPSLDGAVIWRELL